ncbi:hypothetical protein OROGR_007550 [Orobanche gracilis]
MNSVDFQFELADNGRPLLFLFERGRKKLMEETDVVFKMHQIFLPIQGESLSATWIMWSIICGSGSTKQRSTYRKVMRKDNITEEVLLKEISEIIRLLLYADRIQRDIKAHQHMVSSRRK